MTLSLLSTCSWGVGWEHTLDWLYVSLSSPPVAGVWWEHTLDWLYDSLSSPPVAGVWWEHTLDCLHDSLSSPPVAGVWWAVTYVGRNSTGSTRHQKGGGQLKNPSGESEMVIWPKVLFPPGTNDPVPSASVQKRAFSFYYEQRNVMGTFSKRHIHFMIIIIHLHKKHMDINCCTLSLICLWECELFRTTWVILNHALDGIKL